MPPPHVPVCVHTVPSHVTCAPPSGKGVEAGQAPEQPPPWHPAHSTRKHPFDSRDVVSVCPPGDLTVTGSPKSHGMFSQYLVPLDPCVRTNATGPRHAPGPAESVLESPGARGPSRLPSVESTPESPPAASRPEPLLLELDPPLLEPLSPFDASTWPLAEVDVPQWTEQRLAATIAHQMLAEPPRKLTVVSLRRVSSGGTPPIR
jgi:hypothetical protein